MNIEFLKPLFPMITLTFFVGVLLLFRRVRAVRNRKVNPSRFKYFNNNDAPEDLLKVERHFINLFEVPTLFYPALIIAAVLPLHSNLALPLAWTFVCLRYAQAFVHLWPNRVLLRMIFFLSGFFVLIAFWGLIAAQVFER